MDYAPYAAGIQNLLTELNASKGLDLEFDPRSGDNSAGGTVSPSVSCSLHRRSGENRIMNLTVTLFDGFDQLPLPNGNMALTATAKGQVIEAIEKFWTAGNRERHISVLVPQPPFEVVTERNYR